MTLMTLLAFLGASMALTIAPGPDNIFVITQGISRGRRAAIVTALGMCSGISVHTLAAAAGVSALFYASALAFNVVKYAGAGYLLYLAVKAVMEHSAIAARRAEGVADGFALFRRGFIMNVLNPKVALFFLAFLPQFTRGSSGNIGLQMVALGLIFMVQAVIIFTLIGFFSGTVGEYVLKRPQVATGFSWLSAGIFAALGLRLALAER
jgi:threonine/homoserine/homoserine lactone efflux protein